MRRHLPTLLIALALISAAGAAAAMQEQRFGPYDVRISEPSDGIWPGRLEILLNGRVVYRGSDRTYGFADGAPIGADLTGSREPMLAVSAYSNGGDCCFEMLLFGLGPQLRLAAPLPGGKSEGKFERTGGLWYYIARDWTFAGWKVDAASSPACRVVLAYQKSRWRLAAERMRRGALPGTLLNQLAAKIRGSERWRIKPSGEIEAYEPQLPTLMLDLVYTGNPAQAETLLDAAWPPKAEGKARFLRDFRRELAKSPYARDIRRLAKVSPPGESDSAETCERD
ncbi:MAG TPA: hypothetical protein VMC10_12165 [Stellaceae bacterium]|nr:hypothetical protein [Stellaceae bacterium]